MILDLPLLDAILRDEALTPFAEKHFNLDVPAFAYGRMLPTCEAIAAYVFDLTHPDLVEPLRLLFEQHWSEATPPPSEGAR